MTLRPSHISLLKFSITDFNIVCVTAAAADVKLYNNVIIMVARKRF